MPDLKDTLTSDLQAFPGQPLRESSLSLLRTLGYHSDKNVALDGSSPQAFLDLLTQSKPDANFDQSTTLFSHWTSADLLNAPAALL